MTDWMTKGCQRCRTGIPSGRADVPQQVATSIEAHAHLRHCPFCGAWWEVGEREAHVIEVTEARRTFSSYFNGLTDEPRTFSAAIQCVLAAAEESGCSIETVAQWSKALVVHMARPLSAPLRSKLQAECSDLRHFRHDSDPHYAASEGFMDERSATAISFPL